MVNIYACTFNETVKVLWREKIYLSQNWHRWKLQKG
jgi:hypothetical protein